MLPRPTRYRFRAGSAPIGLSAWKVWRFVRRVADDGLPVTTLSGELADQAALVGVLNQLYNLRVAVLSVTRVNAAHD